MLKEDLVLLDGAIGLQILAVMECLLLEVYTVALVTSTVDPYYHFFLPVTVSACTVPSYVLLVTISACTVPSYVLLLPSRYPHTHTALRTNVTVITINPESLFLLTLWRAAATSLDPS